MFAIVCSPLENNKNIHYIERTRKFFLVIISCVNIFDMRTNKLNVIIGDILGGLNAAIIALPQALAFGVATGIGALAGLWGAIILCFTSAVIGGRAPLISGITGPVAIIIASVMHALHSDVSSVFLIILLAGMLQLLLSMTAFSSIIKYIPYPVISGFLNGIGVIIIIMQLNPLIGCPIMSNTITSITAFFHNFHSINYHAFLLGLLTLLIVFLIPKRFNKIIPSQAIALVLCTFLSVKLGLDVEKVSHISASFPKIIIPKYNLHDIITYFHYAIILAIVLSSESLLTVLVSDSLTKNKTSSKRMLIGQGVGNIFCALTGSLPGAAATMRTVAAINSGATTKLSAMITPIILVILLFELSDFVAEIPLSVLAAILIKIGYDIIDAKLLKVLKYAPKDDLYVLWLVFILTVFYNLIVAVGAGITGAAVLYAKKMADNAKLVHRNVYDEDIIAMEKNLDKDYKHQIRVVHIDGQFFFGSATQLVSQFEELWGTKYLILDYSAGALLDISALFALKDIVIRLQSQNIKLFLVLDNKDILKQLSEHDIISQIGENSIFFSEFEAIEYAKLCLKKD